MIAWNDLYTVVAALVPLYVSMLLAYASVRYWKLFSSDQCSGINRFVSLFAVPLLSFHFISTMNPYTMNLRFLVADSLQKLTVLLLLSLLHSNITLKFFITFFSLSTLPNTLVMGIPLLSAMYGSGAGTLMVQVVVLQCIIWYTLLLFLYEYDSAKRLMADKVGHEIVSLTVDSDVAELGDAETEVGRDGNLRVSKGSSRRLSNLTGVEVCSVGSSRGFSPRGSNFEEWNTDGGKVIPEVCGCDAKELHMFVWNSEESPPSETLGSGQGGSLESSGGVREIKVIIHPDHLSRHEEELHNEETKGVANEVGIIDRREEDKEPQSKKGTSSMTAVGDGGGGHDGHVKAIPPARVMSRLILIMVWRKLIRNPNTYSSLIGVVWSLVAFRWDVHMPKVVENSISILSDAGLGMAMFSLGLFMALQPKIIACGNRMAVLSMGVRFLVGPAVMAVAALVVGIRGTLLHVAIVQAALPQGIVPFVFAKEYNVHAAMLCTAVIFGMLIALPITLLYYILLGL